MEDEQRARIISGFQIGQELDSLSVDEIDETISCLKEEIDRLNAAKAAKQSHLSAAESLFGKSH